MHFHLPYGATYPSPSLWYDQPNNASLRVKSLGTQILNIHSYLNIFPPQRHYQVLLLLISILLTLQFHSTIKLPL
jgi:hypothetical protein